MPIPELSNHHISILIKEGRVDSNFKQNWVVTQMRELGGPPTPLILAGWHCSSNEKRVRWQETIEWSKEHKCEHLIPELKEEEKYYDDEKQMDYSYGEDIGEEINE